MIHSPAKRANSGRPVAEKHNGPIPKSGYRKPKMTDAEIARAVELYNAGMSTHAIGAAIGQYQERVRVALIAAGVTMRTHEQARRLKDRK